MTLLTTIEDPNFKAEAEQAIQEFCSDVRELDYIEHGSDNIIALVNQQFVFRFPRNEQAARRLAYETALLQKIAVHINVVIVPQVLKVHNRPLYTVASYIPGEHFSGQQVQALSEQDQKEIGRKVAEFINQLNTSISGLEVKRLRTQAALDDLEEPWAKYFERLFVKQRLPNEKLRPIVEQYYALWRDYASKEQATFAIHDDLHPRNLLFLGPRLNGIVDFGDINAGSIESELRWLYLMGDIVLASATARYQELSGMSVNQEHIRVWAVMHELSSFTDRLTKQQTSAYPFVRAQENLRRWIPNFPL